MLTLTFQFNDIASAAALLAKLNGHEVAAMVPPAAPDHPNGRVASVKEIHAAGVQEVAAAPVEKSKRTSAATPAAPAPSPRTAEVAEAAAPAKTPAAPASSSAASAEAQPPASTAATEPFPYSKLQALVFKLLPDHGAALLDISKKHGAAKFKELPADKWEAAYNDLVSTYGG